MIDLKNLLEENEVVAAFSITNSYCEYNCIIQDDSDDVGSALEDTLHRILENDGTPSDVLSIMGAFIPSEEEMDGLEEYQEYTSIDLGYIIPGLIMSFTK